jgi:hypothetical protein
MRWALALLGLLTGLLLGTAARYGQRWAAGVCFCAFAGAAAYLGVSPTARWLCLLSAAAALWLLEPGRTGQFAFLLRAGGVTLAAVGLFALVWALSPVENPALSAWEEHARDVLAQDSVAYADQAALQQTSTPEPTENPQPVQEEDAALDVGGEDAPWLRPLRAGLLIVLFALLLFVPSLLSDWQKRRRARNRAGLNSPDCAAAVRAAFLYAMRWLTVGGLSPENCPYSGYAPQIAQRFSPQLCTQFQAALPLWQEAAYSDHPMTQNQRGQMLSFSTLAQQTVWEQLDRKGRFLAKYVYAL